MNINSLAVLLCMISMTGSFCSSRKGTNQTTTGDAGPVALIYKTNKDYSPYVPVTLSEDKKQIVAYPGTSDIYYRGVLSYPTKLDEGYYLDNRGINKNTVFVHITYEEYSKLKEVPTLQELYTKIIDLNPLLELHHCGNRHQFKNEVADINKLIESGISDRCKCLVGKTN